MHLWDKTHSIAFCTLENKTVPNHFYYSPLSAWEDSSVVLWILDSKLQLKQWQPADSQWAKRSPSGKIQTQLLFYFFGCVCV